MTQSVAVIDYGMGNLHSVASALKHVGAGEVIVSHEPDAIARQAEWSFRVWVAFVIAWLRFASWAVTGC
ncbi:MAG: hypothetical protein CM15mP74_14730 [Halieaceae bacterium]|nr:MAG: hypothetical protein CM15mP74_14730 [Halieaceae bacterium]